MGDFIPSGDINFSALERNNEKLKEVMSYVRIILTISIGGILLRQFYLVFLSILGVNIAVYGQEQENKRTLERTANKEKQRQERQEQNWRNQLEKQKYNEWLRSHRK